MRLISLEVLIRTLERERVIRSEYAPVPWSWDNVVIATQAVSTDLGRVFRGAIRSLGSDGRLVHLEAIAASRSRTGLPENRLPPGIVDHLGITDLWSHQAEAFDRLTNGESTVIASGTASGKSLCFQLPILDAIDRHPGATALIIYPTKALAHNQLRSFSKLGSPNLIAATHDGDSSRDRRLWVRRNANVVLTNPEMVHVSILPNHQRWSSFLSRLRYIVIDELHVFRGVFGTNVGHMLRRLRRIAAHHGAKPTFAFTSATIGDPALLAADLIAGPVAAVVDDGSPRAERLVALWSGSTGDPDHVTSASSESAMLAGEFIGRGHRTLTFCQSRQGAESLTNQIKERLSPELAAKVSTYRGGYLATERREVEDRLFDEELMGVVATSALELGIDVGGLDVAIINGFPGTVSSFRQQIGRVGRRDHCSLAILVMGRNQLDQWFLSHPTELFTRGPERVVINPSNPFVLRPHLACAAHELPLSPTDDHDLWADALDDGVRDLVQVDLMRIRNRRGVWTKQSSPAREISLRSGGGHVVRIVDAAGELIGTVNAERAPSQVHPGARYVHQGQPWEILDLDLDAREATARVDQRGAIRTRAMSTNSIEITAEVERQTLGTSMLYLGEVDVVEQVTGYQVKDRRGRVLTEHKLDLPPTQLLTTAFWLTIGADAITAAGISTRQVAGTLHAIEHAAIGVLPLFTICDRWDVGGLSTANHHETAMPTIFVYDGVPGGAGVAALGFDQAVAILNIARSVISGCSCEHGCPGCVQSPKCGNGNEPLDKQGASALLQVL